MSWPPSETELTCIPREFVNWLVDQAPENIARSEDTPEAERHRMLFVDDLMPDSASTKEKEEPLRNTRAVLISKKEYVRQILAASISKIRDSSFYLSVDFGDENCSRVAAALHQVVAYNKPVRELLGGGPTKTVGAFSEAWRENDAPLRRNTLLYRTAIGDTTHPGESQFGFRFRPTELFYGFLALSVLATPPLSEEDRSDDDVFVDMLFAPTYDDDDEEIFDYAVIGAFMVAILLWSVDEKDRTVFQRKAKEKAAREKAEAREAAKEREAAKAREKAQIEVIRAMKVQKKPEIDEKEAREKAKLDAVRAVKARVEAQTDETKVAEKAKLKAAKEAKAQEKAERKAAKAAKALEKAALEEAKATKARKKAELKASAVREKAERKALKVKERNTLKVAKAAEAKEKDEQRKRLREEKSKMAESIPLDFPDAHAVVNFQRASLLVRRDDSSTSVLNEALVRGFAGSIPTVILPSSLSTTAGPMTAYTSFSDWPVLSEPI